MRRMLRGIFDGIEISAFVLGLIGPEYHWYGGSSSKLQEKSVIF